MKQRQLAMHRTILAVDVEGFGDRRRTHLHQVALRDGLYKTFRNAFARCGFSWEDCLTRDCGDGVLVLIPPEVSKTVLTATLPHELAEGLREHNAVNTRESQMRLRVALHAGEVLRDDNGVVGAAVILVFRILNAAAVKSALAESPGALALVVSDWFFDEVVRHDPASAPATYRQIRVAVKETHTLAWLSLPDQPYPEQTGDHLGGPKAKWLAARILANRSTEQGRGLDVARPVGDLPMLPPSFWESEEVGQAAEHQSPGAVVALARKAYGMSQDVLGRMANLPVSAISQVEKGDGPAYDMRVLRPLQQLLGIPAGLLGLSDRTIPLRSTWAPRMLGIEGSAVERHTLVSLCAAAAVGGGTAGEPVDPDITNHLLVLRRIVNDADNWRRSDALMPAVSELYNFVDGMRRSAGGEARRKLLGISALYAEFYGWLCEEVGDLPGAVRWTTQALQQAQAGEHQDAIAYAFVRMSQLAEADGDNDRVVGPARAAHREDGISAAVRAMALSQEAAGLARAGDETCLAKLDSAQEMAQLITDEPTEEYRLGFWYSEQRVELQRAACWLELGRPREAIEQYEQLRRRWEPTCAWEQGVNSARMAFAYALTGELDHAAAVGFDVLALARQDRYPLINRELRRLSPWAGVPEMAELVDAVNSLR